ncbi:MAG: CBS domain-containing protein, partial [Solirubrobacteraceae bacterium]
MEGAHAYEPRELLARVRSLPAAGPLLANLGEAPNVHLVGGAVRDLLLGQEPPDLDLVVEGDVAAVVELLGGVSRTHERFGTATVTLDGFTYDIAAARRETYEHPGALPIVEPATLAEDLTRRDFTVNAMALALGGPRAGTLTTVDHARGDLGAGLLRVLHERSFEDDPTRLFRLARYASRLQFGYEPATEALAHAALAADALGTVSGARLGAELRLAAREPDPIAALGALGALGVSGAIHPGFGLPDPGLARRALRLLPADGSPELLVLAAAARGVPADGLAELLERLAFDAAARETIRAAALQSGPLAAAMKAASGDAALAIELLGTSPELVALAGALGPAGKAAEWLDRLRHVRLEIDGTDLLAAGVAEGPAIGRGLRAALAAKLDGR